MKLKEFKIGMKVYDRWWSDKTGVVKDILKTRVKIKFKDDLTTYDLAHLQFLERFTLLERKKR
jgi:hypothetical protein